MLPKKFRLPAKYFRYVYSNSRKFRGKYGMLLCVRNDVSSPLFGFVVSKKIGNSVKRHRVVRMLRAISMEAVKEFNLNSLGYSFEYVSFIFPDDFSALREEFFRQVNECISKS